MPNPIASNLHLAFDVGHSSIGWSVIRKADAASGLNSLPEILGTGVVTFGADDCLAVKRRRNRQARRHARATRQRIGNMVSPVTSKGTTQGRNSGVKITHPSQHGD